MCRKDTHAERSKRSKRGYKPRYKAILHYYKKRSRDARKITENIAGKMIHEIVSGAH